MKKMTLIVIIFCLLCLTAEAKTCVLRDKLTGEPVGTASISDEAISDWAKNFILVEADESYCGKHGHEIKYENGELRHATAQEISNYLAQQEQEQENAIKAKKKQELLDLLEDIDVIDKIKDKVKP